MEKFNIDYSTKNIPLPSQSEYQLRLIEKTEHFIRRMRWKAFFFLHPEAVGKPKETYGFRSTRNPPHIEELKEFENDVLKMIQGIRFRQVNNPFLDELRRDSERIKKETKLIIAADKTSNFYKVEPADYSKLLDQNITKAYKKASADAVKGIHSVSKSIAAKLDIADRVDTMAEREAYVTLKDHKDNFANKPTCRLINPTKSELGRVSKLILDRINQKIRTASNLNQWRNTASVIEWFKDIKNKTTQTFICFDIEEFYPSISQDLLTQALNYASTFDTITDEERHIITHTKNSILIHNQTAWQKKKNPFDVTMGSYDGAEVCEIVGNLLLSQMQHLQINVGLYRDDALAVSSASPREVENIKKKICNIFSRNGLRITIEANKQIVNFLDVTLNLQKNNYQPYMKPNTTLRYVHAQSNHAPSITRSIPVGINDRLSALSSDREAFEQAAAPYQKALDESGYNFKLQYQPHTTTKSKNRQRNIVWFNPPFSKNVSTNIGRRFLALIDKHFGHGNILRKIFNRNTIKVSYSCMNNTKQLIDNHNKSILSEPKTVDTMPTCNCRNKKECPLDGHCLKTSVVYQAKVTREDNNTAETYVGLTGGDFKTRYNNHTASFRNDKRRNATELSKYIWHLKDNNIDYSITWQTLASCSTYNTKSKRCNLCLREKLFIICQPSMSSLNRRNELASCCAHRKRTLLCNAHDGNSMGT